MAKFHETELKKKLNKVSKKLEIPMVQIVSHI